jgi:outer membrane immunogenic protein
VRIKINLRALILRIIKTFKSLMKKFLLLTTVMLICITASFAQAPLGKGGAQLNAGLGFSSWGTPIYLGADFGVHPDITIGPTLSFRDYNYNYLGAKYSQNLTIIGFNGNYHFNKVLNMPSKWNVYAGLTIGYYIWSSGDYAGAKDSDIGWNGQIGARYFFSKNFGVNLEFGGGTATGGGLGITYKIK